MNRNEYMKKWRLNNKEKLKTINAKWYQENKEFLKEKKRLQNQN